MPVSRTLLRWVSTLTLGLGLGTAASLALAADGPIVLGRSLVLSGPLQSYGEAKRDGGDAYLRKVNANGGVGGRRIEVVTLDDAYLPDKTVANLRKMAAENSPTAFLGLFGVPTVAAALPVLSELRIPAVGLTSGAAVVRTPYNRYAFPVRASYAAEARKLVSHVKTVGTTKVAVIHTDNPFGESVKETLLAALKEEGLSPQIYKIDAAAKNAAEVAAQVRTVAPQAVFLAMLSPAAIPTLRELNANAYRGARYAFSPVDASVVTKQLGEKIAGLAIAQVVPIPSGIVKRVVAEYVQAMKELGHGSPSFYGLEAYIEAKVLVEGLRRAGTGVNSQTLVRSLETMNDYDAGDFLVSYKSDFHAGSNWVEVDVVNSSGNMIR